MTAKYYAAIVFFAVLLLAGYTDMTARQAQSATTRADLAGEVEGRARVLSDIIARETSAVDTLAAFVELTRGSPDDLQAQFDVFAEPIFQSGGAIQSVQLAPDAVIEFVFPLEGNEAAQGLDLLADEDRRRLLEPAIASGATVVQGPVGLVQGGTGVLVRKPIYNRDGSFFGFTAILLNWDRLKEISGIEDDHQHLISATRVALNGEVIAGDPLAFDDDPEIASLQVGPTETIWEIALRPREGWSTASASPYIWVLGALVAAISASFVYTLVKRPEVLRRERERVVKELAFAEARYRATFDHAAVGVAITDTDGRILSANPAMARIASRTSQEELKGTPARDLLHPDDVEGHSALVATLHRGEKVVESEARLRGADERWVRVIVTLISSSRDDDLYVSIVEDITARRDAEKSLAESEARFRQLFEQAPISIQREDYSDAVAEFARLRHQGVVDIREYLMASPERLRSILGMVKIIDANPASDRLQGHLAAAGDGLTLIDRLSEPAHVTFLETLAAVWEGKASLDQSVETVGVNGGPCHLDVRWSAPLVDGHPDYSRMMVTISDITDLREAQERLETLIESKDRFVASVAHELRTPLTAVVGFAQALKDESHMFSDRERDEFRELIALHSAELSNIIEDLLVWARGDIGEVKVSLERIDVGQIVRTGLTAVSGLDVEVEEPGGAVEAIADPSRVRQIVRNLATNAQRYGGDHISISISRVDDEAFVDVLDDGPVLRSGDMKRIFEPYARSERGRVAPGSIGLGLSVSLSLARLQGGDLVCFRQGDRNVFRVVLPAVRSEELVEV